jgi:hypothetical protein
MSILYESIHHNHDEIILFRVYYTYDKILLTWGKFPLSTVGVISSEKSQLYLSPFGIGNPSIFWPGKHFWDREPKC